MPAKNAKLKTQNAKLGTKKAAVARKIEEKPSISKITTKSAGLTVDIYSLTGKKSGTMQLPKEIFGAKVNNDLIAQAVRVYLANQRLGTASTKTRGEVEGSSRKIYRQKGTGRARHGSIRANIFVKGGIVFGPRPHDFSLKFPKKMKKAALLAALSSKATEGRIKVLSSLSKIEPKTKMMYGLLKNIEGEGKSKKILIVTDSEASNVYRAGRNIKDLEILSTNLLNTYQVLRSNSIYFMKEAIEAMTEDGKRAKN